MRSISAVRLLLAVALAGAAVGLAACEDDPADAAGADAGPKEGGADAPAAPHAHDAAREPEPEPPDVPIPCTEAELAAGDSTDGGVLVIEFNTGANPRQYTNHCLTVRVGASVTFRGSFRQHPLEPAGGDTPSPIPTVDSDPPGQELVVTFPSPGTYGYRCTFHPTLMFGAIRVVP